MSIYDRPPNPNDKSRKAMVVEPLSPLKPKPRTLRSKSITPLLSIETYDPFKDLLDANDTEYDTVVQQYL